MTEIELVFDSEDFARLQRTLAKLDSEHLFKPMASGIAMDIMGTKGLNNYPAETWRNRDTGRGYWYERNYGYRGTKDKGRTSAPLHAKWYHTVYPDYLKIGNQAPYAGYVHGEQQAPVMAEIGWRKLLEVAKERLPGIIKKLEAQALKVWETTK